MTDTELGALVLLLQAHSALGRISNDELVKALRFAESAGYTFKAPKAD
jgi:hypothetical protein